MSKVHLSLSGQWALCRASVKPCPRDYHLEGMTLAEARDLPKSFIDQLIEDPRMQVTRPNGDVGFFLNGKLHSIYDLPALIKVNGTQEWHKAGRKHRLRDKPAVIRADGMKEWWVNGQQHRGGDKPAPVSSDGQHLLWMARGESHRDGELPSAVYGDGSLHYWTHNRWERSVKVGETGHDPEMVKLLRDSPGIR